MCYISSTSNKNEVNTYTSWFLQKKKNLQELVGLNIQFDLYEGYQSSIIMIWI